MHMGAAAEEDLERSMVDVAVQLKPGRNQSLKEGESWKKRRRRFLGVALNSRRDL